MISGELCHEKFVFPLELRCFEESVIVSNYNSFNSSFYIEILIEHSCSADRCCYEKKRETAQKVSKRDNNML